MTDGAPRVGIDLVIVSLKEQRLSLLKDGKITESMKISSSQFGAGEDMDSDATPRGLHFVAEKFGDSAPIGAVFESRELTGEIVEVNALGRKPVVTRILRLGGLEAKNRNTYDRMIYIHGTPAEKFLGMPASSGCIRLSSADVLRVFASVEIGGMVYISEDSTQDAIAVGMKLATFDGYASKSIAGF